MDGGVEAIGLAAKAGSIEMWANRVGIALGQLVLACTTWLWSGPAAADLLPLRTAAALSARPKACPPRSPQLGNLWQDARVARGLPTVELCARMAHLGRLLSSDVAAAARLVQETVGSSQPWQGPVELEVAFRLLQARVSLANGQPRAAMELFRQSEARLPLSEWDPTTLRDYAVSAVAQARYQEVVSIYRRLVAVSPWLDTRTRVGVRIEAAVAVLRLPQPDVVEALGYLVGLETEDSDASVARLVDALQTLARTIEAKAVLAEGNGSLAPTSGLRGLARLSAQDWRLIESWMAWVNTREPGLWVWTTEAGVPEAYRAFALKLTSGG